MSGLSPRALGLAAGGLALGLLGYASLIEPYQIEVVHVELFCPPPAARV